MHITKDLHKRKFQVKKICEITGIARSVYYSNKDNTTKHEKDMIICEAIKKLPKKIQQTAGAKPKSKLLSVMLDRPINHKRVERIAKKYGLQAKIRRRKHPKEYYKQKKEERKNLPSNILNREFVATTFLSKLVTDISYFRVKGGWLYLSPILDLYNREIVAYACSRHVDAQLAVDTVTHRAEKYSLEGVLLHSDQGATYTSHAYREKLTELGMIQSMSRRGNCWDNACIENFFGTIKCESGYYDTLKNGLLTYKQMEELIGKYIEFFNNERIQKKLGWKSPVDFRTQVA
ncbi:IS3 family transposase [Treponema phagedenis]|uniref:IS3 family transposase n=1 Tax=Treponema phagedenis TaxID=162 RepID=UPI002467DE9E|nr:IS3 family transposase [Treponema phagedenis]